jgi:hypothetical protein
MTRMHSIVRTAVVVMVASLMSARAVHAQDCSVATLSSDFVTSWVVITPLRLQHLES